MAGDRVSKGSICPWDRAEKTFSLRLLRNGAKVFVTEVGSEHDWIFEMISSKEGSLGAMVKFVS